MAERGIDPKEEQKSYASIFVIGIALLVALSIWAFVDDNFTRRPWKAIQAQFYRLDYSRAKAAYDEENKKLQEDSTYQELTKKLAEIEASLTQGAMAKKLAALEREEVKVTVRFREIDQEVKFIRSELEEAWYEYDHAVQQRRNPQPYLDRIKGLEAEEAKLSPDFEKWRARRDALRAEIRSIRTAGREIETELAKLSAERDRWVRVMENATFKLGPFTLYKIPHIIQVSIEEFDRNRFDQPVARVDRCVTCHLAINRPGFEEDPNPFKTHPRREQLLGDLAHPPETLGCTGCHEGQGPAVNSVAQAHGNVKYWETPLLRGAKAQSSCTSCHLDVQKYAEGAPLLAEGQRLFEQIGCTGCHLVQGYENIPKVGPSLRKISAKVDPGWMLRWIENPHNFRPRTRMPNFELSREDSIAIAAYLWSQSKEEGETWLKQNPLPAGFREGDANEIASGKKLVETVGCKGCHGFAEGEFTTPMGKDKDLVPNLKDVASKGIGPQWIYHWIRNPRGFQPDTPMPSLRLTDEEARSITAYLMTLGASPEPAAGLDEKLADAGNIKRGESLVRKWGCFGCHDIKGMENESRVGAELTTFGSKFEEELAFGNRTDVPHSWGDWTFHKLKTPRGYTTPRIEQLMPQFALADEDIEALVILLGGFRERKVGHRYRADQGLRVRQVVEGRRLMQRYNCIGCHEIENRGGYVKKYYEDQALAPPPLNGQGEKVQSQWFYGFMKAPIPLRPWLDIRMPTFGLSERHATELVNYFNGLSKIEQPFVYIDDRAIPPEQIEAGKRLASRDYFDCFSCHVQGDRLPEGPREGWAPDLALARQRLSPSWIIRWLNDPQQVQPGTRMPSFYPGGPDDILGGNEEKQIEALRDYLLTLGRGAAAPAPGAAAKAKASK